MQFISDYWDALVFPLAIIAGSIVAGILFETLVVRLWSAQLFKRGSFRAANVLRAFRRLITTWFAIAAFQSVVSDLPVKAKAALFMGRGANALLVLTITILVVRLLHTFLRTTAEGHRKTAASISIVENVVSLVLYIFGLLTMFRVYGVAVTPFITALGVGGLAVALALQDTLTNFFAGVYVILSKQIDVGDFIKLSTGEEGMIEDIAWRVTTLKTATSNLIIIPNNKISTNIVTNFDKPNRTAIATISFTLSRSADTALFEKIALEVANQLQADFAEIVEHVEPMLRYLSITDVGIQACILIHVVEYSKQPMMRHEFLKRLMGRLNQEGLVDTMFVTRPFGLREPEVKP